MNLNVSVMNATSAGYSRAMESWGVLMPKPRHLEAKPMEDLISYHDYKDSKINCGLCYRRTSVVVKIKHRNYPWVGAATNRVMTICPSCRDSMVRVMTVEKLMGRV